MRDLTYNRAVPKAAVKIAVLTNETADNPSQLLPMDSLTKGLANLLSKQGYGLYIRSAEEPGTQINLMRVGHSLTFGILPESPLTFAMPENTPDVSVLLTDCGTSLTQAVNGLLIKPSKSQRATLSIKDPHADFKIEISTMLGEESLTFLVFGPDIYTRLITTVDRLVEVILLRRDNTSPIWDQFGGTDLPEYPLWVQERVYRYTIPANKPHAPLFEQAYQAEITAPRD